MTKLISGRVKKIPSANVSASRYEFIKLSETEPDLGLPVANGYVLASNVDGIRTWIIPVTEQRVTALISTTKANIDLNSISELLDVDTTTISPVLGYGLIWNGTNWVPNVITVSNAELANVANTVLSIVQGSIVANTAVFAERSNVANTVLSLGNLTTANLAENVNLYYTNARVHSNIVAALPTYTGNVAAGNVIVGTGTGGSITGANLISANNISADNWLNLYTANVIETSGNLYYTDNRVYANVTNRLINLDSNIVPAADEVYNLGSPTRKFKDLYLSGFTINLGNTVLSSSPDNSLSVTGLRANTVTANVWNGIYTANVIETDGNLYYTNARVKSALSEGTGVSYDKTSGTIAIGQNVAPNASVTFAAVSIYGPLNVYGNVTTYSSNNLSISDNMIYLNTGSTTSNPDLGIAFNYNDGTYHHAGFFRDHADGRFKVFDNYAPEPDANVYLDTSHPTFRLANIQATTVFAGFVGNVTGFVSSIDNFTTTNLVEGINLYYSNTRANLAIDTRVNKAFIDALGVSATTTLFASSADVANTVLSISNFSTSNLAEGTNLYYTNARVYSNVISILTNYATVANLNLKANVVDLTTANVVESASNLYYTVARANTAIDNRVTKAFIDNLGISGSSAVFAENANIANTVTSISNFTTSNLAEGTNLYYTNNRVYANVITLLPTLAGTGISIAANGRISSDVSAAIANITTLTGNISVLGNLSVRDVLYANAISVASVGVPTIASDSNIILAPADTLLVNNKTIINGNLRVNGFLTSNGLIVNGQEIVNGTESITNINATNIRVNAVVANSLIINGSEFFSNNDITVTRITANIWTGIYTANVIESASNLYFTNARAVAGVSQGRVSNLSVAGNVSANIIIANSLIINGSEFFSNNDISVNRITANIWTNLYTANVIESASNLYFTNSRVYANVIALMPSLAGNNISISANGQISAVVSSFSLPTFYTANVIESASNLYYTNARARAAIYAGDSSIIYDPETGSIRATGNVIANIQATIETLSTANVSESASNLYYTNARVLSYVTPLLNAKANVTDLTTANVIESDSNLYYTNARVRSALSEGTGVSYDSSTGVISIGQDVATTANVTFNNMTVTGNLNVLGNLVGFYANTLVVTDPLIQLGYNNPSDALDLGFVGHYNNGAKRHAGVFRDATDSKFKFFDNFTGEPTSTTIDTADASFRLANVVATTFEGNVVGNVTGYVSSIDNFTTSNLVEGDNLYYSNVRANAAIVDKVTKTFVESLGVTIGTATFAQVADAANTAIFAQTANIANAVLSISNLSTTNLPEGNNLYYTNARVASNITSFLPSYTGNIQADIVYANTLIGTASGGFITGANLISTNIIVASTWTGIYTANVIETPSNLYYTNSRVQANVIALLPTLAGTGIAIDANGVISASLGGVVTANTIVGLNTANVLESASNLYYTNARVLSYVTPLLNTKANVVDLTTANVAELTNLYYTNARVYSNIIQLLPEYTGNVKADTVYANAIVGTTSGGFITGANLISTNIIIASTWTGLYTSNIIENGNTTSGNVFFTNARAIAAFTAGSGIAIAANGQISSTSVLTAASIAGLNTANVSESDSNLYYTNARVRSTLSSGTGVVYDQTTGVIAIGQNVATSANVTFAALNVTGVTNFYGNVITHSSNNLSISDNMIYLNSGSESSNPDLGFAGNYNDGVYAHAGFFRDASDGVWKVYDGYTLEPDANIFIDTTHPSFRLANLAATTFNGNVVGNVTGFVNSIANFTTSNLVEGNNLYYTNARVAANVVALLQSNIVVGNIIGNVTVTGSIVANGLIIRGINVTDTVLTGSVSANTTSSDSITANSITSNVWNNLYTANVIETAGNLYFTNTRVVSALIAGNNITIEANGRISSGDPGSTQLTISSSQQLTGGNKNYTLSGIINNANSIIVSINGMVQTPTTDYTINGGQGLEFSANTPANALIEIRYYGYSALAPNVAFVSSSVTLPTVAGQASYMMGANVTQAQSIMVALDGLIQRPTVDYTVNNTTITMIPAPPEGSNIEIRFFGQEAVALGGAQSTTAYISNSRTYAGGSANLDLGTTIALARNIIVNIDGVTQIPDVNYTVSGNTLSFGSSVPATSSIVEVKFFGAEAFNANLTTAMVTAVLPTVLSNDTLVRQIVRSSAYAFSRIFY